MFLKNYWFEKLGSQNIYKIIFFFNLIYRHGYSEDLFDKNDQGIGVMLLYFVWILKIRTYIIS